MLYRKYRPTKFSEVEGQEHVVKTLRGTLTSGKIGHAYLFCGTRGTGKTTLARIFAKVLNCEKIAPGSVKNPEPCNECPSCQNIAEGRSLDLIEVDAASNRGIDEIRNLRESARVASSGSRYKVFIIDEVHMLTKEAFNALLKTLEEPPPHIVFIMATTEPHKLPETILSRVQRFDFRKLSNETMAKRLKKIIESEHRNIEDDAVNTIVSVAGGSMRDAESVLTKLTSYASAGIITNDLTRDILGIIPLATQEKLARALLAKDTKESMAVIKEVFDSGANLEHFTDQFLKFLRQTLIKTIDNPAPSAAELAALAAIIQRLSKARAELAHSPIPQLPLELAVIEITKNA